MSDDPETQTEAGEPASRDDLEAYVAANPEEVARFLDRLDVVNELLDLGDLATSAMDDEMVESLTDSGTNLAMAADGMATEEAAQLGAALGENATEVAAGVETIAELQRTGTLDDLAGVADLLSLLSGAADDEMVKTVAATGGRLAEVADTAADDDVVRGLEDVLVALGEASADDPEPIGARGLVRAMRDPEVKTGLGILLSLAGALGRRARSRSVTDVDR